MLHRNKKWYSIALIALLVLSMVLPNGLAAYAGTPEAVASWTFPTTASTTTTPIAATSGVNKSSATLAVSGGRTINISANSTIYAGGWNAANGYWQAQVSTLGYSQLTLSSRNYGTSTGPKDFKIQYSLDGTDFTDVPNGAFVQGSTIADGVKDLVLPSAVDNQPAVYIRWLNYTTTSIGGGTTASGGNSRISDISIMGISLTGGGDSTPSKSTAPAGSKIQFTNGNLIGDVGAVSSSVQVAVYGSDPEASGTELATTISSANGSFSLSFNSSSLSSVYVTATESGKTRSDATLIKLASLSDAIDATKVSYSVDATGKGTITGSNGAAGAASYIRIYADSAKMNSVGAAVYANGSGGFTSAINTSAPNTIYISQQATGSNGYLLEGAAVSITKLDTSAVTPINTVRAADASGVPVNLNQTFTVEGTVTFENGKLGTQKSNFYIQDATGGINIYGNVVDHGLTIVRGDKIKATGKVLNYNGLVELEATSVEQTGTSQQLPDPKEITIADLNNYAAAEPVDGLLATLTGKVSNIPSTSGSQNITIVDEAGKSTILRVMAGTGIDLAHDLELNKTYTFVGIVGQYDSSSPYTTGYELFPRDKNDIMPELSLEHTPIQQAYKATNIQFKANASGAASVKLYYKATSDAAYTAVDMVTNNQSLYSVTLAASVIPVGGFDYYIEAVAGSKKQQAGPFHVTLVEDTEGPMMTVDKPSNNVESVRPEIVILLDDPSGVDASSVQMWINDAEVTSKAVINGDVLSYTPDTDLAIGTYAVKVTAKDKSAKQNVGTLNWSFNVVERFTGGNHYYGTTHNHTNISHDAAGSPEDALKAAQAHNYDWFAFSDHSHDIDACANKTCTDTVDHNGMPERTGGSDWQLTKDLAAQYTHNGSFVVFPAFEMTSTTWGHSNVFGTSNFIDRVQDGGKYQNLQQYYGWILTYDNIVAQFNHPDMSANAFDNFIPYDKKVDKLFTMLEVGNGSGKYSYANAEDKFFSALDLGWHVSPTYGEDNHDATWGQTNKRTVIVANDLSQDSLLDAMRKMHVYMTEDPNAKLDVLASGWYMGSTVDTKDLQFNITGSDSVKESASDPKYSYMKTESNDNIAKVELITNGGRVIDTFTPTTDSTSFNWKPEVNVVGGQQWFVVRVTQKDGDRLYSSPIWSPSEAISVKVNNVVAVDGAIIGGFDANVQAGVTNMGTVDVNNITAKFYYDQVDEAHAIGNAPITSLQASKSATVNTLWVNPPVGEHKVIVVLSSTDADLGTNKFEQSFTIKPPLGKTIMIEASKKNENTTKDTGGYPDNLKLFTVMMKQQGYTVVENTANLTDAVLNNASVLFITHPATPYSTDEIAAVNNFVAKGRSVFLAEDSNYSVSNQALNSVLSGIGSSILVNNDSIYDESENGNFFGDKLKYNYAVKAYPTPVSNHLTDFVPTIESFMGASLAKNDGTSKKAPLTDSSSVTILVRGNETTFQNSPTVKEDAAAYNVQTSKAPAGPALDTVTGGSVIPMVASETIGANGGRIIVSGMNIFHDKEMDQSFNPKGNDPFALNAMNWLSHMEPKVINIADARALPEGTQVVVQGKVTTAAGVFYDSAYVQDDTGGIMAFSEVPEGTLKEGDVVRVYGHIKVFENNTELEFDKFANSVVQVSSGEPIAPKSVSTKDSVSDAYQGQLVKVTGKVVAIPDSTSYVINDGSGNVLVFADGYIINQSGPIPVAKIGDTLEAVGLSGKFSEGNRIRIRDTKELKLTAVGDPGTGKTNDDKGNSGSVNGTGSANNSTTGSTTGSTTVTTITPDKLVVNGDGKAVLTVPANSTEVSLPVNTADLLGQNKLELNTDKMTLDVPASLIKKLTSQLSADELKNSTISLKFEPLAESDAISAVSKAQDVSKSDIKLAGEVYEFKLSVKRADGTDASVLSQFDEPITIHLKVDASIDPKTAGIYYISDSGALEFVGGTYSNGEMVALISHFSKYAVLQVTKSFTDVASSYWAAGVIKELAAKQIVNGMDATTFAPERNVTRAEFTTLLVRALKLTATEKTAFTDVLSSDWYADAIAIAVKVGIANGKSDSIFDPNAQITREEMVTMMMRAYTTVHGAQPAASGTSFKDEADISTWAAAFVKQAAAKQLIQGRAAGVFDPQGITTRAEAAQVIYNLLTK
ncbi:S-layer homology domain-containing protein [Paenibacillus aestuarii]|uniref:S-layer homology domain-containing protein n=1 Tax=Paenibacillus aestuarii TaxID=516965 RepID=A0ABW0K3B1_9BACL|nr:DUF4350 domain-containing protein [Paenibacillus aestuarii]